MEKYDNIRSKVLEMNNYYFNETSNINLDEKIVTYWNGVMWKIIPLNIFLSYPVVYDRFYDEYNRDGFDVSVSVCPNTLAGCVYYGKYSPSGYYIKSALVLIDDKNNLLPIISGYITTPDGLTYKAQRWELKIMIHRNAISKYADPSYLHMLDNTQKEIIKLNNNYFSKSIHPLTLVYVINYKSSFNLEDRYTILIGNDANYDFQTGYDLKKSGVLKYLELYNYKLQEKSSFVMPLLWSACSIFFPSAKIIYL